MNIINNLQAYKDEVAEICNKLDVAALYYFLREIFNHLPITYGQKPCGSELFRALKDRKLITKGYNEIVKLHEESCGT